MIGNESTRFYIVNWIQNWKKGTKPLLLLGQPGIGKTTIVNIIAKKFMYDIICLNASDVRNKQQLYDVLNPITNNFGLFGNVIVFIDEVDGIHGRHDYGGVEMLIKILKEPVIPIILAANSDYTDKIMNIKKVTKTVYFHPVPPRLLLLYIRNILKLENIKIKYDQLYKLVIDSKSDIRSMLNSLQVIATGFKPIQEKSLINKNIEICVTNFFNACSIDKARTILYSMRVDPYTVINAFYSTVMANNIPLTILTKMLQSLSKADMLYAKIIKTQSWTLLKYLNPIIMELYHSNLSIKYSKFSISWKLLNKILYDGNIVRKILYNSAMNFHVSKSTFATFYLPYMLHIQNKNMLHDSAGLI